MKNIFTIDRITIRNKYVFKYFIFQANSNDVIEYSGDRTTEEMFKFLEKNVEKYEPKKTEEKDEL